MYKEYNKVKLNLYTDLIHKAVYGYKYFLILYDDDPPIDKIGGGKWEKIAPPNKRFYFGDIWKVEGNLHAKALADWFYMGGWLLLASQKDTLCLPKKEIDLKTESIMRATNAAHALYSFHDNTDMFEWPYKNEEK
ncbi:MAG: hypothetical protein LBU87_04230 [Lactobacillales bacterium]|jgi:hypothetical protein|nr:hypothetical protein [Lactobacillales bacterium]